MLHTDYSYFLFRIVGASLLSVPGIITVALVLAALLVWRGRVPGRWRGIAAGGALLLAGACFVLAFMNAVYTYDEQPDTLVIPELAGTPTCGTAVSGWIRGGYGMGNPCPAGCFRGKILMKQMRMRGLPPWPEYRREMQCWARD
ncbi:MAG: hypothetical protein V2J12_10515 [Gammaproteobacteria bacterium]|jgi:hypothetical protein|nr:hypothetical protein [Gammaproteobacteria bacterium]